MTVYCNSIASDINNARSYICNVGEFLRDNIDG